MRYMTKHKFFITTSIICISSLLGCAGPNYAPVNTRAPARIYKAPEVASSNSEYMRQPAPPSYASTSPINQPTPVITDNHINEPVPNGYYRIMPGDTLYKVAREKNILPKDLIEWNALDNPNNIQPYQLIRISSNTATSTSLVNKSNYTNANNANNITNKANISSPSLQNSSTHTTTANNLNFIYPIKNVNIIKKFDGKGVDFSGKIGDAVLAAGDGTVIYANTMRGYGNLVIVAHALDVVTAYAHLQHINVKEQQKVKQGQTIAYMGNTQAEQVKLHFEIRKKSEPIDPIAYIKQK
jgi:murein DD-endopeptidase MepM/ murein hydrolase activator NlpD